MAGVQTSLDKSLALLVHAIEDGPFPSLSALAERANLPTSTAHRLLGGLERAGLIARGGRNRYLPGATLRRLAERGPSIRRLLVEVGQPILADLSRRTRRITHLGVLEDNMVTYLIKEGDPDNTARSGPDMQLEAYCTGVGKALLAHLPQDERDAYLSTAPFVALTASTITAADVLLEEFGRTRARGYALDRGEMFDDLVCIAVPIRVGERAVAAISLVVTQTAQPCRPLGYLARVLVASSQIERRLSSFKDVFASTA